MFRLRVTAMVRSKSGMRPMLANSSKTKCTVVGSEPPCASSASAQSALTAVSMSRANRKSKVESVSLMDAKSATLAPSSPMWARPSSSLEVRSRTARMDSGFRRTLQLESIDFMVSPAATRNSR